MRSDEMELGIAVDEENLFINLSRETVAGMYEDDDEVTLSIPLDVIERIIHGVH